MVLHMLGRHCHWATSPIFFFFFFLPPFNFYFEIAQVGLELEIVFLSLLSSWNHRCILLSLAQHASLELHIVDLYCSLYALFLFLQFFWNNFRFILCKNSSPIHFPRFVLIIIYITMLQSLKSQNWYWYNTMNWITNYSLGLRLHQFFHALSSHLWEWIPLWNLITYIDSYKHYVKFRTIHHFWETPMCYLYNHTFTSTLSHHTTNSLSFTLILSFKNSLWTES